MALRTCNKCGLEAHTQEDLEKFRKTKSAKYGRSNQCKKCGYEYHKRWKERNPNYMKEYLDRWRAENPDHYKNWRQENLVHLKRYDDARTHKTMNFKGKLIRLKDNPRTNQCYLCEKTYPEHLKQQTSLHHIEYDMANPLANTIELCHSCHHKLHHILKQSTPPDSRM